MSKFHVIYSTLYTYNSTLYTLNILQYLPRDASLHHILHSCLFLRFCRHVEFLLTKLQSRDTDDKAGIVTIVDCIKAEGETSLSDSSSSNATIAHFTAHTNSPISALSFDRRLVRLFVLISDRSVSCLWRFRIRIANQLNIRWEIQSCNARVLFCRPDFRLPYCLSNERARFARNCCGSTVTRAAKQLRPLQDAV